MITQLLFAGFLAGRVHKKQFFLAGIYLRVLALASLGFTIVPFYVVFSKTMFGLDWHQVGNFLLPQFTDMILSTIVWNQVASYFKFKGIVFGFIIIASLLPLAALFFSRHGIAVYQWIFLLPNFLSRPIKFS